MASITPGRSPAHPSPSTGNDTLKGGEGHDVASYIDSPDAVRIDMYNGVYGDNNTDSDATGDTLEGIEQVNGSIYNDAITGNDEANDRYGFDGAPWPPVIVSLPAWIVSLPAAVDLVVAATRYSCGFSALSPSSIRENGPLARISA